MRIIIVGCGRVGSALAAQLAVEGHDVRVVDEDARERRRLPRNFPGRFVVGKPYSRAVLERAGVDAADALVAVSAGDNRNIVTARTARDTYRVPIVVARIYDPRRAEIYSDLGIPTVASVRWEVWQIRRMLLHRNLEPDTPSAAARPCWCVRRYRATSPAAGSPSSRWTVRSGWSR